VGKLQVSLSGGTQPPLSSNQHQESGQAQERKKKRRQEDILLPEPETGGEADKRRPWSTMSPAGVKRSLKSGEEREKGNKSPLVPSIY